MTQEKALAVYVACLIARTSGQSSEWTIRAHEQVAQKLGFPAPKAGATFDGFIAQLLEGEE